MTKFVDIHYTHTFERVLDYVINHLASYSNELQVIERIEEVIADFEQRVSIAPYSCQISPSLFELGVTQFREYNHHGFRILYRVIEVEDNTLIYGDLLLAQKQNVQKALVDFCLLSL